MEDFIHYQWKINSKITILYCYVLFTDNRIKIHFIISLSEDHYYYENPLVNCARLFIYLSRTPSQERSTLSCGFTCN